MHQTSGVQNKNCVLQFYNVLICCLINHIPLYLFISITVAVDKYLLCLSLSLSLSLWLTLLNILRHPTYIYPGGPLRQVQAFNFNLKLSSPDIE